VDVILAELQSDISDVLVRHIEPMFVLGVKLTLVARFPGEPSRTVIVSSDDIPTVVTEAVIASTSRTDGTTA